MATDLQFHDAANLFPLMKGAAFDAFKEDIHENGQKEKIVLFEGKILDGRNRYLACKSLRIEPITKQWEDNGSAVRYAVSENLHRRHLTNNQRGLIAVEVRELRAGEAAKDRQKEGGEKGRAHRYAKEKAGLSSKEDKPDGPRHGGLASQEAAEIMGTSRTMVDRARQVLKHGCKVLIEAVRNDIITITPASFVAYKLPKDKQEKLIAAGPKAVIEKVKQFRVPSTPRKVKPTPPPTPELITRIVDDVEVLINQLKISKTGLAVQRKDAITELRMYRTLVKKYCQFLI